MYFRVDHTCGINSRQMVVSIGIWPFQYRWSKCPAHVLARAAYVTSDAESIEGGQDKNAIIVGGSSKAKTEYGSD